MQGARKGSKLTQDGSAGARSDEVVLNADEDRGGALPVARRACKLENRVRLAGKLRLDPMNRAFGLLAVLLSLSTAVQASPPPPLPWISSRFSVPTDVGAVDFTMDCPDGVLTRLSATQGELTAHLPMERLKELSLSRTCSGVTTRAMRADEGTGEMLGIELTIELSQGYVVEELVVFFDLPRFQFTKARRLLTYPAEEVQVSRVSLD